MGTADTLVASPPSVPHFLLSFLERGVSTSSPGLASLATARSGSEGNDSLRQMADAGYKGRVYKLHSPDEPQLCGVDGRHSHMQLVWIRDEGEMAHPMGLC